MKFAISLKDPLFLKLEQRRKELNVSRSTLVSQALKTYLEERQKDEIIASLNRVYREVDSSLDPGLTQAQAEALREEW